MNTPAQNSAKFAGTTVLQNLFPMQPNCSEVPDTCFLWYFVQFFFVSARNERFFLWVHQLSVGISPLAAGKSARDLSDVRSGYRLGFIWGPLRISLGIYPVNAWEIA